jgi:hypothetical protein
MPKAIPCSLFQQKAIQEYTEAELEFSLKMFLHFQLRWDDSLNQRMINNIKVSCLLLRMKNPREIAISALASRTS